MNRPLHHDEVEQLLHRLLATQKEGNSDGMAETVEALVEWHSRTLHTVLSRVAQEFSDSLSEISSLRSHHPILRRDLPDARSRLGYVVNMTERAAHRTLDCVEKCRRRIDELSAQPLPGATARTIDALRGDLSEMLLAQEYQDLSGQIICGVIGVVRNVESALTELNMPEQPSHGHRDGITGPAVPGLDAATVSQIDADALLAGLGV